MTLKVPTNGRGGNGGAAAPAKSGPKTDAVVRQFRTPWHREFLVYDPATALRKVSCPVLAMIGQRDCAGGAQFESCGDPEGAPRGGNQRFEVLEMPGLNHPFQTAKTGAVSEYEIIEETISPVASEKISGWIAAAIGRR